MAAPTEFVKRILLVVAGLFIALCLLEIPAAVKLLDYRTLFHGDGSQSQNIFDPELLHIHRPYAQSSGSRRGGNILGPFEIPQSDMMLYRWDVKFDGHGFRNPTDLTSADIVMIGDSFVEGTTIPRAELASSLLGNLQGKVVANLGQNGYGPTEELVVLRRFGLPLRPRTVVWIFYEGNDLADVKGYRNALASQSSLVSTLLARSFTKNSWLIIRRVLAPAKPSGARRRAIFRSPQGTKTTMYFTYESHRLSNGDLSLLADAVESLETGYRQCAAQGVRLVVVLAPMKFRVIRDFCEFPPESECASWGLSDLPERLPGMLKSISSEIGYLDLTSPLVTAVRNGLVPYYSDDAHWSEAGHKVAAQAIHQYLQSR